MKTLFIGGHADGKWQDIPADLNPIRLSIRECHVERDIHETILHESIHLDVYNRHTLGANEKRFHVFVHSGLTLEAAMQRLLDYYRPDDRKDSK